MKKTIKYPQNEITTISLSEEIIDNVPIQLFVSDDKTITKDFNYIIGWKTDHFKNIDGKSYGLHCLISEVDNDVRRVILENAKETIKLLKKKYENKMETTTQTGESSSQ